MCDYLIYDVRKSSKCRKHYFMILFSLMISLSAFSQSETKQEIFCGHPLKLDDQQKILPWFTPIENAYDHFLHLRWNFIKTNPSLWNEDIGE